MLLGHRQAPGNRMNARYLRSRFSRIFWEIQISDDSLAASGEAGGSVGSCRPSYRSNNSLRAIASMSSLGKLSSYFTRRRGSFNAAPEESSPTASVSSLGKPIKRCSTGVRRLSPANNYQVWDEKGRKLHCCCGGLVPHCISLLRDVRMIAAAPPSNVI